MDVFISKNTRSFQFGTQMIMNYYYQWLFAVTKTNWTEIQWDNFAAKMPRLLLCWFGIQAVLKNGINNENERIIKKKSIDDSTYYPLEIKRRESVHRNVFRYSRSECNPLVVRTWRRSNTMHVIFSELTTPYSFVFPISSKILLQWRNVGIDVQWSIYNANVFETTLS